MTDLAARRGDRTRWDVTITDANGTPVDISGVQDIWFTAKHNYRQTDAEAVVQKTLSGGGIAITDGPNGVARITLANADLADLPARSVRLVWDVQIKDGSGVISTPLSGYLTVSPDVTLATS